MSQTSMTEWNGQQYNAFQEQSDIQCDFKLTDLLNRVVLIHGIKAKDVGKFSGTIIQVQVNSNEPIKLLYSSSNVMREQLLSVEQNDQFPIVARIKKVKNYYTLSNPDSS